MNSHDLLFSLLIFAIGFVLLVWGSNLFVDTSIEIAEFFHVPELIIGATIVSLGTTLPELLFSTTASYQGLSSSSLANALGSIICNTGLIGGLVLSLQTFSFPSSVKKSLLASFCWFLLALFLYVVFGLLTGGLSRVTGFLLIGIFILFSLSSLRTAEQNSLSSSALSKGNLFIPLCMIKLLLEAGMLYLGAHYLVEQGPVLARILGVPDSIISLTLVALGTSLPELMTSVTSLLKHKTSLSLGNILGADFLNLTLVGGLSAAIRPIPMSNSLFNRELPVILFLICCLCLPVFFCTKTKRLQGALLLGAYLIFTILSYTSYPS